METNGGELFYSRRQNIKRRRSGILECKICGSLNVVETRHQIHDGNKEIAFKDIVKCQNCGEEMTVEGYLTLAQKPKQRLTLVKAPEKEK